MPKKIIRSFKYAGEGTKHALLTQRNMWIHSLAALLVLFLAFWLKLNLLELAVLVLAIFLVIVTEMVNTAIEEFVDILSPEHRKEAGLAKNVAAGAVLLASLGAVIIGGLVFIPKLL